MRSAADTTKFWNDLVGEHQAYRMGVELCGLDRVEARALLGEPPPGYDAWLAERHAAIVAHASDPKSPYREAAQKEIRSAGARRRAAIAAGATVVPDDPYAAIVAPQRVDPRRKPPVLDNIID